MRKQTQWARFAIATVTLSASVVACDSVLDIEDPKIRPNEAGASGDPNTGATDSGGDRGGSGGTSGNITPPGSAGQAGELPGGGAGGEGGTPVPTECTPNDGQCGGDDGKMPQICDETGHWVTNANEEGSNCSVACVDGQCQECMTGDKQCTVCENDDPNCDTNLPQTCVAGVWTNAAKSCAQFCDGGSCVTTPSCGAAGSTLTACTGNESCCRSFLVPGGDYERFDEDSDVPLPTKVKPFLLDKFEVTVGRFRQFVNAYAEVLTTTLKDGAGKSNHVVGDVGWNSAFAMPANKTDLVADFKTCSYGVPTWADDPSANNTLPVNCVSFNVAYAFCIWDGGRLPTDAEWQFAAGGGDPQRIYPWILPVSGDDITHDYANYADAGDDSNLPRDVGTKPLGNGRWGHADLAGNLGEWTLDYFHAQYPTSCTNCLDTTASPSRSQRGGGYSSLSDGLFVASHSEVTPTLLRAYSGFRCARDSK